MRMSTLPIAAALAIGLSSLAPAQSEAKTFARCKVERAACVINCIAYPCPQRCQPRLTKCAKGGGGEPPPKDPMFGKSTGAGGGLPPVAKQSKR